MKKNAAVWAVLSAAGLCTASAVAQDQTVIISEFLAASNQAGGESEGVTEFIEIYNYGTEPVDIGGWTLQDDSTTGAIPLGEMLMPGEAVVLYGSDPFTAGDLDPVNTPGDRINPEVYEAIWGPGIRSFFLETFENLSNSPSATNEILLLVDANGMVVDEVNFDDNTPWPNDQPDGSAMGVIREIIDLDFIASQPLLAGQTPKTLNDNGYGWSRHDLFLPGSIAKLSGDVRVSNEVYYDGTFPGGALVLVPFNDPNAVLLVPATNQASPGSVDAARDTFDCNGNGIDDDVELLAGLEQDAVLPPTNSRDGILDSCAGADCDDNGVVDAIDIGIDRAGRDCDNDGVLDSCQIADNAALDADGNGRLDICDVGNVIITEISYNTVLTPENDTEWVEFTNVGATTVSLEGWGFVKLDQGTDNGFESFVEFPSGLSLQPGESIVLVDTIQTPDLVGLDPVAEFRATWGEGFQVIPADAAGFFLANNASPFNEILALFAPPAGAPRGVGVPAFVLVDSVDYDSDDTNFTADPASLNWPLDGEFSIQLKTPSALIAPGFDINGNPVPFFNAATDLATANNFGGNWTHGFAGLNDNRFSTGGGVLRNSVREQGSPGLYFTGANETDGSGEVIITEIFMAPNTPSVPTGIFDANNVEIEAQPQNEWVEIHNTTGGTIDISGWYLQDEDGRTTRISEGSTLAAGEVAVIFGTDQFTGTNLPAFEYECRELAANEFYRAWGGGYQVFAVEGWNVDRNEAPDSRSLRNLANNPSAVNEVLALYNADGDLVDFLNWNDAGSTDGLWPNLPVGDPALPSFSIFLLGDFTAEGNNNGFNWLPIIVGLDPEARNNARTDSFSTSDAAVVLMEASPGILPGGDALDLGNIPPFDACPPVLVGCNIADIAADFGVLNVNDIIDFVNGFNGLLPIADVSPAGGDGLLNVNDVIDFVNAFNAGCP